MRQMNTSLRNLKAPVLHAAQYGVHRSLLHSGKGMSQNYYFLAMLSTPTFLVVV